MNTDCTLREERNIPVHACVDVLVAGGGVAGVAAAIAAARMGKCCCWRR